MNNNSYRRKHKIQEIVFWCALGLVCLLWVVALAQVHFVEPTFQGVHNLILMFGAGLTVVCGILWVAHVTHIITLETRTATLIWGALIVSVLVESVAIYKTPISPNLPSSHIKIDQFVLLQESEIDQVSASFKVRLNPIYESETAPIAFLAVVSGFAIDDSRMCNISAEVILHNPSKGIAEIGQFPLRKSPEDWEKRRDLREIKQKDIEKIVGDLRGKTVFSALLTDRKDIGSGQIKLRFIVKDNLTHSVDEAHKILTIRENSANRTQK